MIKLYGISVSRAFRPLWLLEELGVEYENVPTHFATGETHAPEYLKLNPNGHIPTLVDGDLVLWESMAINLYLARKYDKGLWPRSEADQARTAQWSFWAMTETEQPLLTVIFHRAVLPAEQREPPKADEAEALLGKPLAVLDGALAGREHLLGGPFTVCDLNVAAVLSWARLGRVDLSDVPNVARWLERCLARPAAQRARGRPAAKS